MEDSRKLKESSSTSSVEQKPQVRETPLTGKKVLLVEAMPVLRGIDTILLSKLGAIVYDCGNGKEAFDLVSKLLRERHSEIPPYDYILMEIEMPVMDGYESTKLIREEEKLYGIRIPIIAMTANYALAEEASINAGMDFHMTKPLKVKSLMEAITSISV